MVEIVRLQVVADNNLQNVDPTADGSPTVPMVRCCSTRALLRGRAGGCIRTALLLAVAAGAAGTLVEAGLLLSVCACCCAVPQSVWWQIPQYMLVGE